MKNDDVKMTKSRRGNSDSDKDDSNDDVRRALEAVLSSFGGDWPTRKDEPDDDDMDATQRAEYVKELIRRDKERTFEKSEALFDEDEYPKPDFVDKVEERLSEMRVRLRRAEYQSPVPDKTYEEWREEVYRKASNVPFHVPQGETLCSAPQLVFSAAMRSARVNEMAEQAYGGFVGYRYWHNAVVSALPLDKDLMELRCSMCDSSSWRPQPQLAHAGNGNKTWRSEYKRRSRESLEDELSNALSVIELYMLAAAVGPELYDNILVLLPKIFPLMPRPSAKDENARAAAVLLGDVATMCVNNPHLLGWSRHWHGFPAQPKLYKALSRVLPEDAFQVLEPHISKMANAGSHEEKLSEHGAIIKLLAFIGDCYRGDEDVVEKSPFRSPVLAVNGIPDNETSEMVVRTMASGVPMDDVTAGGTLLDNPPERTAKWGRWLAQYTTGWYDAEDFVTHLGDVLALYSRLFERCLWILDYRNKPLKKPFQPKNDKYEPEK